MPDRSAAEADPARKRVVVLLGAGASIEYGAPSTNALTSAIEQAVLADAWARHTGGDKAYADIRDGLKTYLNAPPNFEHIYHVGHELLALRRPSPGAYDEFRPVLYPFLQRNLAASNDALRAMVQAMSRAIFTSMSGACEASPASLGPLSTFLTRLRAEYVTRIYTTNYDDFVLQAAPDLYTGFDSRPAREPKRFELDRFWQCRDLDCVLHLHGSVHMAFGQPAGAEIGELCWFDDRSEALKYASFNGSGELQMDGTQFERAAAITGFDKLARLQQRPLSHFYTSLAEDMMAADLIVVIGSGLADLHLNSWLKEARSRNPKPSLIFVGYWQDGYLATLFDPARQETQMMHALDIIIRDWGDANDLQNGWAVAKNGDAAVWDRGFQGFLGAQAGFPEVSAMLIGNPKF